MRLYARLHTFQNNFGKNYVTRNNLFKWDVVRLIMELDTFSRYFNEIND